MTFPQSLSVCFKKAFITTGRASRSEFWWMALVYTVCLVAYLGLYISIYVNHMYVLLFLFLPILGLIWALSPAMYAVTIRRLQDTGCSGWYLFYGAIPLAGIIILIIEWSRKGTDGVNKYGEHPD